MLYKFRRGKECEAVLRNNSLEKSAAFPNGSLCYFGELQLYFTWHCLNFSLYAAEKIKIIFIFSSIHAVILTTKQIIMWSFTGRRPCYCTCVVQIDSWEVEGVLSWQSRGQLSFRAPSPAAARQIRRPHDSSGTFLFIFWQVCISLIDWHHKKSFIKAHISSVIIVSVTHKGAHTLSCGLKCNQGNHSIASWRLHLSIYATI